jgi:hypothetical protein
VAGVCSMMHGLKHIYNCKNNELCSCDAFCTMMDVVRLNFEMVLLMSYINLGGVTAARKCAYIPAVCYY